jgi:hypothetical protein
MQARLQHIGLDADLALSSDDASLRHPSPEIAAFFNSNFLRADVYQESCDDVPDDEEPDQDQDSTDDEWNVISHIFTAVPAGGLFAERKSYAFPAAQPLTFAATPPFPLRHSRGSNRVARRKSIAFPLGETKLF